MYQILLIPTCTIIINLKIIINKNYKFYKKYKNLIIYYLKNQYNLQNFYIFKNVIKMVHIVTDMDNSNNLFWNRYDSIYKLRFIKVNSIDLIQNYEN